VDDGIVMDAIGKKGRKSQNVIGIFSAVQKYKQVGLGVQVVEVV